MGQWEKGKRKKRVLLLVFAFGLLAGGCKRSTQVKILAQRIPNQTVTASAAETEATEEAIALQPTPSAVETDQAVQEPSGGEQTESGWEETKEAASETASDVQTEAQGNAASGNPLKEHGALSVSGNKLVDQNGNPYQLYGMSTHGLSWFPEYVNAESFATLRSWNTNCIRLALYTAEYNGYCTGGNQEELKNLLKQGIEAATAQGMYVILDWHILSDGNPMTYKEEAKAFFAEMSALYKDRDNILYEICNEPNGVDWETVKAYAQEVIPVIRSNDSNAVILVGTPEWCQRIDQAAASPLSYDNLLYTVHFYAATHTQWLRDRTESALNSGLPVFISEFGTCDASGNGANDFDQANSWMELIEKWNLSYCCWNLANKAESSSILNSWCTKTSGWTSEDLSESGKWIVSRFQSEQ
jgi:endoglucanase